MDKIWKYKVNLKVSSKDGPKGSILEIWVRGVSLSSVEQCFVLIRVVRS